MRKTNIPAAFKRFFAWFCKPELFEELEGDLEEAFEENKTLRGASYARSVYRREVIRMLRPSVFRYLRLPAFFNHTIMFRNYFKVSLRALMKNPLSSFINITGLSMAIGIAVFAYAFARWTYSTDQFHEHKNEVYLVTFLADRDGSLQQHGQTPRPLGEMLKEDFASVKKMCRVEDRPVVVKNGDNVFHERLRYTDPTFLEMFTFPLKWGSAASLYDPNSIILSEAMAVKYFGEENPLGKTVLVKFDNARGKPFTVTGVAEAFPVARTISFGFLVNFENLQLADSTYNQHDWAELVHATFVQVNDPADIRMMEAGMEKYTLAQNQVVADDRAIDSFAFEPLATLNERSEYIKDDISRSSADNLTTIVFLVVIGGFILLLACFNYINMAIVSAARRLKEIGIRKTIGATRGIVIVQFLVENVVVTSFALILGIVLAMTVFIPGFEQMWHFSMGFSLTDANLLLYLPVILLITAIASGIYPAFYISRFEVVKIMKGSVQFGKRNPLTKILLCIQLVFACIFISSAVMFSQNTSYLTKRSWGYEQEGAMYAEVADYASFEQLKTAMAQHPDVLSMAGAAHHVGKRHLSVVAHTPDRHYDTDQLSVDGQYFETMGLRLKDGRTFNTHFESDKLTAVVNESFVTNTGLEDPVGKLFKIDNVQCEIIGVVSDFHSYNFENKVNPTIFGLADKEDYRYLCMRVQQGAEREAYQALQTQWVELFPEIPFQGGYQEDVWGNYFTEIGIYSRVWHIFAFIVVLLASLGLYGLMTLNVTGRVREFSIRKVLGATLQNIAVVITRQYMILFGIALSIGAPLSCLFVKWLLTFAFNYHMPINFSSTAIAVAALLMVLLISVAIQVRNLGKFNPVKGLKVE